MSDADAVLPFIRPILAPEAWTLLRARWALRELKDGESADLRDVRLVLRADGHTTALTEDSQGWAVDGQFWTFADGQAMAVGLARLQANRDANYATYILSTVMRMPLVYSVPFRDAGIDRMREQWAQHKLTGGRVRAADAAADVLQLCQDLAAARDLLRQFAAAVRDAADLRSLAALTDQATEILADDT
jgi:hypothetical protein